MTLTVCAGNGALRTTGMPYIRISLRSATSRSPLDRSLPRSDMLPLCVNSRSGFLCGLAGQAKRRAGGAQAYTRPARGTAGGTRIGGCWNLLEGMTPCM